MQRVSSAVKTRREMYAESTRAALLDAATTVFVQKGFAGTALTEVATSARVTRGAVYHHFADKRALYEAVLERFESAAMDHVARAAGQGSDPWDAALRGLEAFLDQCCDPVYGRIVWHEGPVALGWTRWRECEFEYGYGLTAQLLRAVVDAGYVDPVPLETATRLMFAMIGEAGLTMAEADEADKQRVRTECGDVLHRILDGLRAAPAPSRREPEQ
jgi:AcrR family transcriptional regulator